MRYLPHTPEEISEMLAVVGADSLEALFAPVPADCRPTGSWHLPPPLSEWQLNDHLEGLAATMGTGPRTRVLVGAGSYRHHIPETVRTLASRSEFLTAYTPYQPEISQGTLQGIFEYQTLTARLLGMDVVNASMYDGATALAVQLREVLGERARNVRVALGEVTLEIRGEHLVEEVPAAGDEGEAAFDAVDDVDRGAGRGREGGDMPSHHLALVPAVDAHVPRIVEGMPVPVAVEMPGAVERARSVRDVVPELGGALVGREPVPRPHQADEAAVMLLDPLPLEDAVVPAEGGEIGGLVAGHGVERRRVCPELRVDVAPVPGVFVSVVALLPVGGRRLVLEEKAHVAEGVPRAVVLHRGGEVVHRVTVHEPVSVAAERHGGGGEAHRRRDGDRPRASRTHHLRPPVSGTASRQPDSPRVSAMIPCATEEFQTSGGFERC